MICNKVTQDKYWFIMVGQIMQHIVTEYVNNTAAHPANKTLNNNSSIKPYLCSQTQVTPEKQVDST